LDIWPEGVDATPTNFPNLIHLALDLHDFKSFDISPLLLPTLEELHIRHDGEGTFQEVISPVALSKLHTLSIALNDYPLCSKLMTPMLRSLIMHPSSPVVEPEKALRHFEQGHQYERLTDVSFNNWLRSDMEPSSLGITKGLLIKSTQLCRLTFISCHVDGPTLLELLQGESHTDNQPSTGIPMRREVRISSCTGITQNDCERIESHVRKLAVCC
jgi:hypothetical protein